MNLPITFNRLRVVSVCLIVVAIILDRVSDSWGLPMFLFLLFIFAFQIALVFLTPSKNYLTIAMVHLIASLVVGALSWGAIDYAMGPGFGPSDNVDPLYPAVKYIGAGIIVLLGTSHVVLAIKRAD